MQVDARERGFSYSYDAPLDMRMDPEQEAGRARDRERLGRAASRAALPALRRGALRPPDRARDRPAARRRPDRDDGRAGGGRGDGAARRRAPPLRGRASRQARVPGGSDRGERRARGARPGAARSRGSSCASGGRLAAISFHSLEDRRVKHFLADRARGCVCPPDFPVCVCGHEPEAELLTRRAVVPSAGEVADNPRSRSGQAARRPQARDRRRRLMARAAATAAARPAPATRAAERGPRRGRGPLRRAEPRPGPSAARGACPVPPRRRAAASRRASRCRSAFETRPFAARSGPGRAGSLDALLAGRGWIVLVGVLLAGIVFFNVDLLRMNREIAVTAEKSTRAQARQRQAARAGRAARLERAHPGRGRRARHGASRRRRRALPQGPPRLRSPERRAPDHRAQRPRGAAGARGHDAGPRGARWPPRRARRRHASHGHDRSRLGGCRPARPPRSPPPTRRTAAPATTHRRARGAANRPPRLCRRARRAAGRAQDRAALRRLPGPTRDRGRQGDLDRHGARRRAQGARRDAAARGPRRSRPSAARSSIATGSSSRYPRTRSPSSPTPS